MGRDYRTELVAMLPWLAATLLIILACRGLWTGSFKWRTRAEPITRHGQPMQFWFCALLYVAFAVFFLWAALQPGFN